MRNYNVYLDDEIIGSVNLYNCNCSKFMYLGTDPSGNTILYKPSLHTIKDCSFLPCSVDLDSFNTKPYCSSIIGKGSETDVDAFCKQYFYGSDRKGHTKDTKCIVDPNTINKNSKGATMYHCQDSSFKCCQGLEQICNYKSNPSHDRKYPDCCNDLTCTFSGGDFLGLCLPK